MNKQLTHLLTKISHQPVASKFFNNQNIQIYIKTLIVTIHIHVKTCDKILQDFYANKPDLHNKEFIMSFAQFLDDILNKIQFLSSHNMNNIKEILYLNQYFLKQIDKKKEISTELIIEADKLFTELLQSTTAQTQMV
ncbi:MAG: hypothetical protein AAFO15_00030 [Pseudomonadota bacterium]